MTATLLVLAGLVALIGGAELLVRAGTTLAVWLGIKPIVVGLTVVSIGTSLPELAIGIDAATKGSPGLAVGNIVGTNLVNILFILGLSALLVPITLDRRTLRFDLPAMTAAALVMYVLSLDGHLSRVDGALLCLGGVAYTWGVVRAARAEPEAVSEEYTEELTPAAQPRPWLQALLLVVGLAIIVIGAELLVDGAVSAARSWGISEAVIGLTVVAVGTSAPELVTTVMSTLRGDREIAIGNLFGSSIYNIAIVLGITIVVAPGGVPVPAEVLDADLLLLVGVAILVVPVMVTGSRISRLEGGACVALYLGYLTWLVATRT